MTTSRAATLWAMLPSIMTCVSSGFVMAAGEVTELVTRTELATPASIVADETTINWGQGENQLLEAFVVDNETFTSVRSADRVSVVRRDLPGIATGNLCGVFAERVGSSTTELKPDLPARQHGSSSNSVVNANAQGCDMAALLTSSLINRGTLDTFTNVGNNPNNIERLDYLFEGGLIAPLNSQSLTLAGHAFGEKNGNNRIFIATVLGLDEFDQPNAFGPLIRIGRVGECATRGICYGRTSILYDYTFLKSNPSSDDQTERVVGVTTEPVTFAFLSLATLGLSEGETYYGVSVFPPDTDPASQDLLDVNTYPDDTEEADVSSGDSADIYGGTTGFYEASERLPGASGRFLCTAEDNSSVPARSVSVNLHQDSNQDGVLDVTSDSLLANLPGTGSDGRFSFSGLDDGTFFVAVADNVSTAATSRTVVIAGNRIDLADIDLGEPCERTTLPERPIADNDLLTISSGGTFSIPVLANDSSASGVLDADELTIIWVSDSDIADIAIDGRTVSYAPGQELLNTVTVDSPALDTFTYRIEDANGEMAEASVSVTIVLQEDRAPVGAPECFEQGRDDCLFVETEVDGMGSVSIAQSGILLLLLLMRLSCAYCRPGVSMDMRNVVSRRVP